MGDGGTSDGEGEGYDVVQGFSDDMKSSNDDCLMNGEDDDVEEGIMNFNNNQSQCLVTEDERRSILSSFYGALPGWKSPLPEENWEPKPCKNNEVPFHMVDNPDNWPPYTFKAIYDRK